MIVNDSWRSWCRDSVVVLTAVVAVLAMHGLTSEHGMGMPGPHTTAAPSLTSTTTGDADAHHAMSTVPVPVASAVTAVVASTLSVAGDNLGHAGGMCVGVLGIGRLLWLLARSRRNRLAAMRPARTSAVRMVQARAGPQRPLLRPSLVKLCISRT